MKRIFALAALLAILGLAVSGCGQMEKPVASAPEEEEQPVRLAKGVYNDKYPINATVNQCDGEVVRVTGSVHHIERRVSGHYTDQFNYQGVSGVGVTSGTRYRVQDKLQISIQSSPPQRAYTVHRYLRMVAQGSNKAFTLRFANHFTTNANGERTAYFSDYTIECK